MLRFPLSNLWNKQSSLRFELNSLCFDLSKVQNKQGSLRFDFYKFWNKQVRVVSISKTKKRSKLRSAFVSISLPLLPKCEIFYLLNSRDFYTIKPPLGIGDFGTVIKNSKLFFLIMISKF